MSGVPLRIAAHCGGGTFAGTETWTARFLAGFQERGHHVQVFARDQGMAERFSGYGIPVEIGYLGGVVMAHQAVGLARKLRRFAPDVFLCLTFRKMLLAGWAGRLARVPRTVFRVANQGTYPRDALYRFAYRRFVDQVLCNADELRLPFLERAPGFPPEQVITVYDGVPPLSSDRPGALRAELGLGPDVPLVGSVGRLAGQKRYDRLVDTLALLPESVHCVIAGDGPLRSDLEARARDLGVAGRLHLLGHRSDVPDVLAGLDVFVITSDFEGMANAMLEAMSMGLPVVSTEVSGAREALLPEGSPPAGAVVPPRPDAIAHALAGLLDDPAGRHRVGRAALDRYRVAFTYEHMLDAWERALMGEPLAGLHQGPSSIKGGDRGD